MERAVTWDTTTRHFLGTSAEEPSRDWFSRALCKAKATHRLTVKELARKLRRTPKAVERILAGDNAPQLDAVIAACREFDEVFEELLAACGRSPGDADAFLDELTRRLQLRRGAQP